MAAILLLALAGKLGREEADGRHGGVERVDVVLREVPDAQAAIADDLARRRVQLADEQLDAARASGCRERRMGEKPGARSGLAGTVRSDYCNARVEADIEVDALQDDLLGRVAKGDIRELEQRRRYLLRFGESDARKRVRTR